MKTLREYLKQKNEPIKHAVWSVYVDSGEYELHGPVLPMGFTRSAVKRAQRGRRVTILAYPDYNYVVDELGLVWTVDEDGNPKKPSVFRLKDYKFRKESI